MLVLSLGTGRPETPEPGRHHMTQLGWALPAVTAAMEGSATAAHNTVFEVFHAHKSLAGYLRYWDNPGQYDSNHTKLYLKAVVKC